MVVDYDTPVMATTLVYTCTYVIVYILMYLRTSVLPLLWHGGGTGITPGCEAIFVHFVV